MKNTNAVRTEIHYAQIGEYQLPLLTLPQTDDYEPLGKYSRMPGTAAPAFRLLPGGRTGQPPALITPLTFLHRFSSFPLSAGAVRRCGTRYAAYLLYTSGFSTPM